jgi:hypothetical protein
MPILPHPILFCEGPYSCLGFYLWLFSLLILLHHNILAICQPIHPEILSKKETKKTLASQAAFTC